MKQLKLLLCAALVASTAQAGEFVAIGGQPIGNNSNMIDSRIFTGEDDTEVTTHNTPLMIVNSIDWNKRAGTLLASGGMPVPSNASPDVTVAKFNPIAGTLTDFAAAAYGATVNSVTWSPNGKFLAVGGAVVNPNIVLKVYSLCGTALNEVACFKDQTGVPVSSIDWSPCGNYLAVGRKNVFPNEGLLQVFSFHCNKLALAAEADESDISLNPSSVSWNCDGKHIAVGGANNINAESVPVVQVYKFANNALDLVAVSAVSDVSVTAVDWSCDGKFLAVAAFEGPSQLAVFTFDGTNLVPFSNACATTTLSSVRWYANDSRLVVGINSAGLGEVWAFHFSQITGITLPEVWQADHNANVHSVDVSPCLANWYGLQEV